MLALFYAWNKNLFIPFPLLPTDMEGWSDPLRPQARHLLDKYCGAFKRFTLKGLRFLLQKGVFYMEYCRMHFYSKVCLMVLKTLYLFIVRVTSAE